MKVDWEEEFRNLIQIIGSITYGKERWFYSDNGQWYDRATCSYITHDILMRRVADAVRDAEEEYD